MEVREDLGDLGSEHAQQRQRQGLDQGDLRAGVPGGRGHLEADPAAADDHHLDAFAQPGHQQPVVVEGAQVDGVRRVGERQVPGLGAGGEQQLVEGVVAVGGRHRVPLEVDRRHRRAEVELDVVVGVPLLVVDEDHRLGLVAQEHRLGEGWAFVGQMGFGGEDGQLAVVPVVAELGNGGRGREATADDHDPHRASSVLLGPRPTLLRGRLPGCGRGRRSGESSHPPHQPQQATPPMCHARSRDGRAERLARRRQREMGAVAWRCDVRDGDPRQPR